MALDRLFGWLTSISEPREEKEEKGKELQPLTDSMGASYGSGGSVSGEEGKDSSDRCRLVDVDGDEFVVVTSSSEGEDSRQCSSELVDGDKSQGPPPPTHSGILKTAHEDKPPSPCPIRHGHTLEWRSRADLPVRMKGAQAVVHEGQVFVGGGYTGNTLTESTVYKYDPTFDLWAEHDSSPVKWFGMAEFKGQLILVGGKDMSSRSLTNQITVWDQDSDSWTHPYPPMSAARSRPVVFCHAHLLVVAGGRNGVLDYHVEVLDGTTLQWTQAPPLPTPCLPTTSLVHKEHWYLLGGLQYTSIHCTPLAHYLQPPESQAEGQTGQGHAPSWKRMTPPPFRATRIIAIGRHVTVFPSTEEATSGTSVQVHQYLSDTDAWVHVGRLPRVCGTASHVRLSNGELLLFGGDVDGLHYSNKVYRVSVGSAQTRRKKTMFVT